MAKLFTTGTKNAADAAAVGTAMAVELRDGIPVHAGWDLVETITPGGGVVWYVFKCLSAVSGLPNDFYVVMCRNTATGALDFFICEGYNDVTNVASFYAAQETTTSVAYDSVGRLSDTFTLSTTALSGTVTQPKHVRWTPSGTSTNWWLIVTDDGFTVAFNGASNGFVDCGKYEYLGQLTNVMPICMVAGMTGNGTLTRNPALASLSFKKTGIHLDQAVGGGSTPTSIKTLGFAGRLDLNDKLQDNQRPVAEIAILVQQNANADSETAGWVIGKQKRMRMGLSGTAPAGMAFGDTYTLNGNLWVPYLPTDPRIWDTGVAA